MEFGAQSIRLFLNDIEVQITSVSVSMNTGRDFPINISGVREIAVEGIITDEMIRSKVTDTEIVAGLHAIRNDLG